MAASRGSTGGKGSAKPFKPKAQPVKEPSGMGVRKAVRGAALLPGPGGMDMAPLPVFKGKKKR